MSATAAHVGGVGPDAAGHRLGRPADAQPAGGPAGGRLGERAHGSGPEAVGRAVAADDVVDEAASSTVRVSGPAVPSAHHRCGCGAVVTRPRCGLSPKSPHIADGMRIDPPPSPPIATGTMPEATAAAVPPLEPPGLRVGSHGLRVSPRGRSRCRGARRTPASRSCRRRPRRRPAGGPTSSASAAAGVVLACAAEGGHAPSTSISSLIATGTPCSGPLLAARSSAAALGPGPVGQHDREGAQRRVGGGDAVEGRRRPRPTASGRPPVVRRTVSATLAARRSLMRW